MEEVIFTLWSLVHIFSGVVLALLFSLKEIKLIEFAGFLVIPLLFIGSPAVKMIALVVIIISALAFAVKRVSKKKDGFSLILDVILTLFLLILWEVAEYLTYPITNFGEESMLNKASDVIFGFIGFLVTYIIIHKNKKSRNQKHKRNHNNP